MNNCAENYVKLALAVGAYSPGYIDAYYGLKEWIVKNNKNEQQKIFPAPELSQKAAAILKDLATFTRQDLPALEKLRIEFLKKQVIAAQAQIDAISGKKFSFDMESKLFYDAVAPAHNQKEFEKTIAALEKILPGTGGLQERWTAFRKDYVIPVNKLPAVFEAAIAEFFPPREHLQN